MRPLGGSGGPLRGSRAPLKKSTLLSKQIPKTLLFKYPNIISEYPKKKAKFLTLLIYENLKYFILILFT